MENISTEIIDGIKLLNNIISNDISRKIVLNTSKKIVSGTGLYNNLKNIFKITNICSFVVTQSPLHVDENIKRAEYSVASLLIWANKHDNSSDQLRFFLENCSLNSTTTDDIVGIYNQIREQLKMKAKEYGHSLPHISNVNWSLSCDLSSSNLSYCAGNLDFKIIFEKFNSESSKNEMITEFRCSPEELQLLINKLKDVERHCDKISK